MTAISSTFNGQTDALIGSDWVSTPKRFMVTNPYSGLEVARVADCGISEAQRALESSVAAFEGWRTTTAYERAGLLRAWFDLMLRDEGEIATADRPRDGKARD